jgi:ATP:ADP antiporter, AAA family
MKYLLNLMPIKRDEISRFIIISFMMLMILFIYSIERTVKDTIVINEMGAELISAIKLYGTMPIAILIMLIYAKLSNELNKTTIFHLFNGFFISYFLIFTFVISPNISYFHFDFSGIKNDYPYLSYFIAMIENWSYSLYFILAELWGSVMLALMFWQTANQVFKITEAKRLYPLFGLVAQLGLITSGGLLRLSA